MVLMAPASDWLYHVKSYDFMEALCISLKTLKKK